MSTQSDNKAQSIDIGRAFDYVKFALKNGWWILMIGTLLGGLIGYISALRVSNEFEVRTTYVMNPEEARIEAEKLQSETRLLRTLRADRKFQISKRVDLGWRGMHEMYDQSPFDIVIGELPPHLKDIPHKIKLFKDESFEIAWSNGKEIVKTNASFGEETQIAETPILLTKTKYWHSERSQNEYDVIFWSDEALQTNYSSRLEVIYLIDRPHRIEISFTDINRQRAFDFLEAYSQEYIQEQTDSRKEALEALFLNSQKERELIESEILKTPFSFGKGDPKGNSNNDWLSLNDSLEMRFKQRQRLKTRLEIWEELKTLNPNRKDIIQRLNALGTTNTDSTMLAILSNPKTSLSFANEYERIKKRDLIELQTLEKELDAEQISKSKAYALRPYLWMVTLQGTDTEDGRKSLILWERYHRINQQIIDAKIEAAKQEKHAITADATHYTIGDTNTKRRERAILISLGGFFLSVGICLVFFWNGRLKHLEQLYLLNNLQHVNAWSKSQKEIEMRTLFTNLDIDLGQNRQIIAIVSHQDSENIAAFVQEMGAAFSAFGHECLYVNLAEKTVEDGLSIPEAAMSSWWMTNEPKEMIKKASEKYDRVFVVLPPLLETPEAKGFLRSADHAYYLLLKDQSHTNDWKAWQAIQKDTKVQSATFFIG